jgi:hypothetical protein
VRNANNVTHTCECTEHEDQDPGFKQGLFENSNVDSQFSWTAYNKYKPNNNKIIDAMSISCLLNEITLNP